jgi:methionyl-tRNA formyltransferase
VLVTTRLRRVATPLIRELKPDLIACFSFPYRITPELCAIPTYGAVNLHPAVLPAYRGPNVMRQFYEGWPVFGATAHWIAPDYDTGHILSQKSAPLPDEVTREAILPVWRKLMSEALNEGMERAIAGDPGRAQDDSQASYAAPFTEEEYWLNWNEPQRVIQRKATALNLLGPGRARANVKGELFKVMALNVLSASNSSAAPGTCIERSQESMVIQVADGAIRLEVEPLGE